MNAQRSLFHDQAPTADEIMSIWNSHRDWLSRKEIAGKLGRAKSPTLVAMLNVLCSIGYLTCKNEPLPNGVAYFKYAATQKWIDEAMPF